MAGEGEHNEDEVDAENPEAGDEGNAHDAAALEDGVTESSGLRGGLAHGNRVLTGFDATTLNTLFVDKRLVNHGLIQAYSRTNRILNSVKTYGNIVSFRDLDENTNEALELFGNADNAAQVAILAPFKDFYRDYERKVEDLKEFYPAGELIVSEKAQISGTFR